LNKPSACSFEDFEKADIRIGTIREAKPFSEAIKPAYKLVIDFGPVLGVRRSSAQLTARYQPGDLVGRQVLAVVNFPAKQIGPFLSECLVLGAVEGKKVHLLQPDSTVTDGSRVS
jgi:tRNA-binding protein